MRHLLLPFTPRYILLTLAVLGTAAFAGLIWRFPQYALYFAFPLAVFGFFTALGVRDLLQTKHAILRNYPIAAHIRFTLEHIRPEFRQYFFENEKDGMPFPRDKRAIVYQRAKKALDTCPFGTHYDVYQSQFEWLHHSMQPREPSAELFRILIGPDCAQPYLALGVQYLRPKFRLDLGQRHPRAQQGRQAWQLRTRYRRGRRQPLSPGAWRGPYLGNWLGLFLLPRP